MGIRKRGNHYVIDYYWKGKRYREAVGPSKKEAEAALGKIKAQIREGKFFDRRKLSHATIEELTERYREWANGKKSFPTQIFHIDLIRAHFAGRLLEDITEYDVEQFRALRRSTPIRNGQPRSAATCNRELACLKGMLNKAVARGLMEKNPAANVKLLPEPGGRTRYLGVEEAGMLLDACPSLRIPTIPAI